MKDQLLFDTSVWIDFLRNKSTPASDLLADHFEHNDQVVLIPTILQEILQGIRKDVQYQHIKDILSYFSFLQVSPFQAAIGAA
jgi:predicted nucleic acid-binding protein